MCGQTGELALGHVVPKWAYRMMSPGSHYATVGGQQHYYRAQDGDKEYLLCPDCEQRLGLAENYLAVLCRGQVEEMACISGCVTADSTLPR